MARPHKPRACAAFQNACYNVRMPEERLAALEQKIEEIRISTRKTQNYLFWTVVVTVGLVVLPAIGLVFAIPSFMSSYNETLQSLDLEGL